MNLSDKNVLVIGGGVAGLSAALELAELNVGVTLLEKTDFLGGHAIQFACKAANKKCVKCGACVAEDKLRQVLAHPNIRILLRSHLQKLSKNGRFSADIQGSPMFINPEKCTGCGICLETCPVEGGICRGYSKSNLPFYAVSEENCRYMKDKSCTLCQDACPENAIQLDVQASQCACDADAVILASGFQAFDPTDKPYGYDIFENVITNLELERMLRQESLVRRPSDKSPPERIAFIQCVGSRDATLGHLWCSKVCCASALRMARLIQSRQAETEISFFFIDVQTFGKDFPIFYSEAQKNIRMVRSIPGDIFKTEDDRLRLTLYDHITCESREDIFDLAVLSVGITPREDTKAIADIFSLELADSGFISPGQDGIFVAGTAQGPMGIAEAAANAGHVAWETLQYITQG